MSEVDWYLIILGCMFDVLRVGWYWSTEHNKAWLAGLISAMIAGCSLLGVVEALEYRPNAIPYLIGIFLGSFLGVKLRARVVTK